MKTGMRVMVVLGAGAALIIAQQTTARKGSAGGRDATMIAHGKYLVTRVGACGDCHTPMGPQGQPEMSRWLQGAPLIFKPTVPVPGWVSAAPGIAGLPAGWSVSDTVRFLQTGLMHDGKKAAPPMPAIRLTHHDAEAIAMYLASLPSGRR